MGFLLFFVAIVLVAICSVFSLVIYFSPSLRHSLGWHTYLLACEVFTTFYLSGLLITENIKPDQMWLAVVMSIVFIADISLTHKYFPKHDD